MHDEDITFLRKAERYRPTIRRHFSEGLTVPEMKHDDVFRTK